MASAFSHAFAAFAIGRSAFKKYPVKLAIAGMLCAAFPDADVIGYYFGIEYDSFWGHRGFIHSIVFAFLFAVFVTSVFFRSEKMFSKQWTSIMLFLFVATASHAFLDAITNGGLGVAFFSPFDNARYFFPWRPVQVSPMSVGSFFSEWGIRVLKSEFIFIWLPSIALMSVAAVIRKTKS